MDYFPILNRADAKKKGNSDAAGTKAEGTTAAAGDIVDDVDDGDKADASSAEEEEPLQGDFDKESLNRRPKFSGTSTPGIFLGYHLESGGAWKGDYIVADLHDLRRGKFRPRIDQTKKIYHNVDDGYAFPMAPIYDLLTRTIPRPEEHATEISIEGRTIDEQGAKPTEGSLDFYPTTVMPMTSLA